MFSLPFCDDCVHILQLVERNQIMHRRRFPLNHLLLCETQPVEQNELPTYNSKSNV